MYPNVILLDYVREVIQDDSDWSTASDELIALAIAINLEITSQNYYIGGGTLTKRDSDRSYYKEDCVES
jgi:hypothetical protein